MGRVSDYIIQKLLSEGQKSRNSESVIPPGYAQQQGQQYSPGPSQEELMQLAAAQGGNAGNAAQGGAATPQGTDPRVDFIAKKLALIEGSPADKYQIFIQLLPQIAEILGAVAAGAAPAQEMQGSPYEVSGNILGIR
mgnify:FL=1